MKNLEQYFATARERYTIFLKREQGEAKPWTKDEVFQQYRFCNVFREDDRVTRFFRKNITPERYGEKLLGAMVIARWINRIETVEKLQQYSQIGADLLQSWDDLDKWEMMMKDRLRGVQPIIGNAYMIKSPTGMDKLSGLCWSMRQLLPDAIEIQKAIIPGRTTLEDMTYRLSGYPFIGPFIAYEMVTDLRHTLLQDAPDINTWANPGPGCARGLSRVCGYRKDHWRRNGVKDRPEMLKVMQDILSYSRDEFFWPHYWPKWEMREVEHWACEFDKYMRVVHDRVRMKQRYPGAA